MFNELYKNRSKIQNQVIHVKNFGKSTMEAPILRVGLHFALSTHKMGKVVLVH